MRKFKRHGSVISTQLSPDEVELLRSLLAQLVELVSEDESPGSGTGSEPGSGAGSEAGSGTGPDPAAESDPFAAWTREFDADQKKVETPEDPVLRRLFPNAYADDPDAASEFRRFTERSLRGKKIEDAQVALVHLEQTAGGRTELRIPTDSTGAWLRSLTSLRLVLATRLGIEDAQIAEQLADLPEDDPRVYLASVYDWLGFAQETLIGAL